MQIGGEWLVAGGTSAEVTGDEGMFSLGTSQLVFLAGNVLQVCPPLLEDYQLNIRASLSSSSRHSYSS